MMTGSIRQRQPGSWELRVYVGLDPDTNRRRYATRTVRGSRRAATAALAELVEDAAYRRLRAGTVGELLERWVATASSSRSASTVRETNSLMMRCHLLPHFGQIPVTKLTTVDIDDVYSQLLRRGGRDNRPLSPGTVHRVHVVLHRPGDDGLFDRFVFSADPAGRRQWQPNWVTKRFIADRRRAGLAHFRLHDLRHFMATTMLAAGVPVPGGLRASLPRPHLDHRQHLCPRHARRDRDAANLLANLLTPP